MKGRAKGKVIGVISIVLLVSVIFMTIFSCVEEEDEMVVTQRSLDIIQMMSMEKENESMGITDETAGIKAEESSLETFYIIMSGPLPMRGISLAEDTDSGLIVCGAVIETESQEEDIILANISRFGEMQWVRTYDRPGLERVEKIVLDDQNNIFVVGWLESNNETIDGFLMKTDPLGNLEWFKTYGDTGTDYLYSLNRTNDGFILAGSSSSYSPAAPWIVRTDSEGIQLWYKCFQISSQSSFYDVKQTSDGGFIMTGGTTSGTPPDYEESARSLLKTDSNGNQQWLSTFMSSGNHYPPTYARSVLETPEGHFVSCGSYESIQSESTRSYLWTVDHNGDLL